MKSLRIKCNSLYWLFKPFWKYGKGLVISSLLINIILVPLSVILITLLPQTIVDMLETGSHLSEIIKMATLINGIILLLSTVSLAHLTFYDRPASARIDMRIKRDVYLHTLKIDYRYVDSPSYYDDYMWTIDNFAENAKNTNALIQDFCRACILISTLVAVIASVGPIIAAIALAIAIIDLQISNQVIKTYVKQDEDLLLPNRRLGYVHRLFYMNNFIADLKSTNLKNLILRKYDRTSVDAIDIIKSANAKMFYQALMITIARSIGKIILIIYIASNIQSGNIARIGSYITVFLAIESLDRSLHEFSQTIQNGNKLSLYAERMRKFFDLKSEIETTCAGAIPAVGAFSVELKNICFRYENSGFELKNIELSIPPGERVAIVGENGAGKTTLVKLLLRLYDVIGGDILINGVSIKEYNIGSLRERIGVAFQNSNIYALTFLENIELYNKVTQDKLDEIAQSLKLSEILKKNNADFSNEVTKEFDEKGIVLSGGEIQKVALARLMTGDFGLLLLDEPSSSLDPLSEYDMTKMMLNSSNRSTTIIVAHRLSSIRDVDRIILFEDGTIKETGTHDSLMALGGKYCEMFTKQAENYVK